MRHPRGITRSPEASPEANDEKMAGNARARSSTVEQGTFNDPVRSQRTRSENLTKSPGAALTAPIPRRESPVPLYLERARRALRRAGLSVINREEA